MEAARIRADVNQFPRLTWHNLHINHGKFDGELDGRAECQIQTEEEARDFMTHEEKIPGQVYGSDIRLVSQMGQEFDAALDAFEDACAFPVDLFTVKENSSCGNVRISFSPGDKSRTFRDIVIHAEKGSRSCFIISEESDSGWGGVLGLRIRILADQGSSVHLVHANLLGKGFTSFTALATLAGDGASVRTTQVELGAGKTFSGARHTLSGHRASNSGEMAYLARDGQETDINYVTHQTGRETESSFTTEGVVAGNAKKTWRGTIDFVKGCVNSRGNESESVLLLSPDAENKSLPVILCDEEAVEGSHGTSIGRLGKDVLFYLQTRGISEEEARALMIRAKISSVARGIPDRDLYERIENFMNGVLL